MFTMYDMLKQNQNGAAIDALARQFNLNQEQTQAAINAVMPAFQEAMRRQADSLDTMQGFFTQLGSGKYERFYEEPSKVEEEPEQVRAEGNDILGNMFGSKDVSRAVADQAAAMSGLGSSIIRQMLPIIASMMMGGLAKQGRSSGNPFQDMLGQMMGGGAGGAAGANPFGEMLQGMFGEMLRGTPAAPQQRQAPGGFDPKDIIDAMFDAGRKTQDANAEAMGRIFDQFMGGGRR